MATWVSNASLFSNSDSDIVMIKRLGPLTDYRGKFPRPLTQSLEAGAKVSHSRPNDLQSCQLRILNGDLDGVAAYVASGGDWGCPER